MKKTGNSRILLNKKAEGNEIYHVLIQILIAITIYWILQSYIDSIAKDTLFEKSYLSKDISLLIDTIYACPGEINYVYANDKAELNRFEFGFSNQNIRVNEFGKDAPSAEQPYGEDLSLPYSGQELSSPNQIVFSKTETNLEINENLK